MARAKQYPGREQVDQDFPSLNLASKPINFGSWLTWTPSLQLNSRQSLHIDQTGRSLYAYRPKPERDRRRQREDRSEHADRRAASFDTPIKIGEFTWTNSFRYSDNLNDFPFTKMVVDPADSSKKQTITYNRDFATTLDWNTGINLPSFLQRTWKVTPSVSFENVDPHAFMIRSEFSNGAFVTPEEANSVRALCVADVLRVVPGIRTGRAIPALDLTGHLVQLRRAVRRSATITSAPRTRRGRATSRRTRRTS